MVADAAVAPVRITHSPGRTAAAPAHRPAAVARPTAAFGRPPARACVWALGIAAAVALTDIGAGMWVTRHVPPAVRRPKGLVQLTRVLNRGASFGLGARHPAVVLTLGLFGVAAVGWWLAHGRSVGELVAVAVLLGGAAANLTERIATGAVFDWIHVWGYPASFNPADLCVRGGVIAAVLVRWWHSRQSTSRV